jgi:hypothetical protein
MFHLLLRPNHKKIEIKFSVSTRYLIIKSGSGSRLSGELGSRSKFFITANLKIVQFEKEVKLFS